MILRETLLVVLVDRAAALGATRGELYDGIACGIAVGGTTMGGDSDGDGDGDGDA